MRINGKSLKKFSFEWTSMVKKYLKNKNYEKVCKGIFEENC